MPEGEVKSTRLGSGLRVYLDRPWFSSGDGEKLGVIIANYTGQPLILFPPDNLKPYITQWGSDPVSDSETKSFSPSLNDFTRSDSSESALTLEELLPDGLPKDWSISVAGHPLDSHNNSDPSRKLWYCDMRYQIHLATFLL